MGDAARAGGMGDAARAGGMSGMDGTVGTGRMDGIGCTREKKTMKNIFKLQFEQYFKNIYFFVGGQNLKIYLETYYLV